MKLNDVRKSLKTEFENNNIDSIDADFIIAEVLNVSHTELNLIDEILISTDYERALCIINNKGLIQESGLTSEFGLKQSNYIEIALKVIRDDDILQDYIKQYINIE